jgi:hypothetical protein
MRAGRAETLQRGEEESLLWALPVTDLDLLRSLREGQRFGMSTGRER